MIVVSDMIVELIIRKLAVAEHYVSRIMALLDESATPGTFGNYLALHDEISKLKQDISSSAFKLGKENYDVIRNFGRIIMKLHQPDIANLWVSL